MKRLSEEDIIKLHDCLKGINIPGKLPEKMELEYYINVLKEFMNRLNIEEQLIIYIFMTYDTLLSSLTNYENYEIEDLNRELYTNEEIVKETIMGY